MNESQIENLQVEKIIVSPDDEIIDVLKEIESTKADRLILTFAEPSDLLISPISLKVLLDSADEKKIPLIALIVQNPTGVRNAKEAGMTVTETSGSIVDTFWEQAQNNMEERIQRKKDSLKRVNNVKKEEEHTEELIATEEAIDPNIQFQISNGEPSEFQKSVASALEKSRKVIEEKKRIIEQNGVEIGLDQEIPQEELPSLLGKNFKKTDTTIGNTNFVQKKEEKKKKFNFQLPDFKNIKLPKIPGSTFLKILAPTLIVLIVSAYIAYISMSRVFVTIYVASKNVSIEKNFQGDLKTTEFDVEKGLVPVKKEESLKSASNSINASGTAYRGNRAEGVVIIKYYDIIGNPGGVTLKAGTVLTSTGGLKFETTAEALINNFINAPTPVKAVAVGEEYNLPAGQIFTVSGYTLTQMEASSTSPFEGGSKTPYTVLSQSDVDKVSAELKKNLIKEAEDELKGKNDETWTLVDKSLVSDLDGKPDTDVPIGAEADVVNITVKTKSTALFYQRNAIDKSIQELLTREANNKNLFENTNATTLTLEENLLKEITITDVKKDVVKIKVKASSNIQPKLEADELKSQLRGKKWNEGKNVINNIKYTDKENLVRFTPEYIPEWLRYFPNNEGKIIINTEEVE